MSCSHLRLVPYLYPPIDGVAIPAPDASDLDDPASVCDALQLLCGSLHRDRPRLV